MLILCGIGVVKGRRCYVWLYGVMYVVVVFMGLECLLVGSFIIVEEGIMVWFFLRLWEVFEGCGGVDGVL